MIDYQRIVEFLRDFRATPGQPVTDEVRRYATEYAERCTQANERLRQCSVFLQQGLRSEAIHLADESPNLLELVAALDLPDAQVWTEFCNQNDLPAPPPLQMDRAGRLNDAYGLEQPVEHLLRRHRRLALGRAPVKDRLDLMRQIATSDTASGFWDKDIRLFERARHKELKVAFTAAVDGKDSAALAALSAEVLQAPWLELPGEDLRTAAQGADNHMRLMDAGAKLQDVMARLRTAFAARDHALCQDLVQQIFKIGAEAKDLGVNSETAAELKPIIAWIRQEDELAAKRQAADVCEKQLRSLLDADAPDHELETVYEKLRGFDELIPADLTDRYQQTLRRRQRAAGRKQMMILAGVVAVLVLAAGIGWVMIQHGNAEGWAHKIHQAAVLRDVDGVKRLIAEQERRAPQFNNVPNVVAAKQEAAQLEHEYDSDNQTLAQAMGQLAQSISDGQQMAAKPEARIEELLWAWHRADQAAQQAPPPDPLAWIDTEGKLPAAVKQLKDLAVQLHDKANQTALAQANAVSDRIDKIAVAPSAEGVKAAIQSSDALVAEIDTLRKITGLDKPASEAIAALTDHLAAKRGELTKGLDRAQRLLALDHRVSSVDAWKTELQAYADAFPDAPASAEFKRAIANSESFAAIEAMQAMEDPWEGKFAATSEDEARKRLDKIKAYTTAHPRNAYQKSLDAYSVYLEQAADALALKSSWQQAFHDLLTMPLISDLKYVTDSEGKRYLVLNDLDLKTQHANDIVKISFRCVNPADLLHSKLITLPERVSLTSEKPELMPHAKYAETLTAQLKNVGINNWDTFGITLIDRLAHDQDMDPVVRAILLQEAMKATVQISGWGVGNSYDQAITDLGRQEVENIIWYDDNRPVSPTTIAALKQIIDSLPKPDAVLKTLKDNRDALFKDITCRYAQIGILMKDDSGAWAVYPTTADAGSTAWTAGPLPDAADQPAALVQVAHYQDGKFQVDADVAGKLAEGTVVFIGSGK